MPSDPPIFQLFVDCKNSLKDLQTLSRGYHALERQSFFARNR